VIYAEAMQGECLSRNFLQNSFLVAYLAVRDENDMGAAPG
jgi:hypothetical protein